MDHVTTAAAQRPLWRRIADFPLVAMLIGVAVIMLGIALAVIIDQFILPTASRAHARDAVRRSSRP